MLGELGDHCGGVGAGSGAYPVDHWLGRDVEAARLFPGCDGFSGYVSP